MNLTYAEQLENYSNCANEIELYLRMNYEWNEDSFQILKAILLGIFNENNTQKPSLYLYYNKVLERISGLMRNPLFIKAKSDEYKTFIQSRIDGINELRCFLYQANKVVPNQQ